MDGNFFFLNNSYLNRFIYDPSSDYSIFRKKSPEHSYLKMPLAFPALK